MGFIENIKEKLRGKNSSIVFPEGEDDRIIKASCKLHQESIITPILLGNEKIIRQKSSNISDVGNDLIVIEPKDYDDIDTLAEVFVKKRDGKINFEDAKKKLLEPNYFGTLLVESGRVDAMVCGAVYTTADTVRPALQIIKTKKGIKKTSGLFVLIRENEIYIMSDCAINIQSDSNDLAEIAILSAQTAKKFDIQPTIAMLSYSTLGSAGGEEVDKIKDALKIVREKYPDMKIDGELQFDSAFVKEVAEKKAPKSLIAGNANVFIFPNLSAGNIGYKIAQRLGGFQSIGPILQGLNHPVNDLSRGCSTDEVYSISIITAAQAKL